jgi:hypothetical protein
MGASAVKQTVNVTRLVVNNGCMCVLLLQTPLLLLDVLLLGAVPVGTAMWVVFADVLMILFGLGPSHTTTTGTA